MWWIQPVTIGVVVALSVTLVTLLPSRQEREELEESNGNT